MPGEPLIIQIENGQICSLWDDALPWSELGAVQVERASSIEYDHEGNGWKVSLRDGTILPGCWPRRSEAVRAEVRYLNERLLK